MPRKTATAAPEPSDVDVVFRHHWRDRRAEPVDRVPGERASVPADVARRLVSGSIAVYATKAAAGDAGDPEGPTGS
jgi:hypothetical protein